MKKSAELFLSQSLPKMLTILVDFIASISFFVERKYEWNAFAISLDLIPK